MRNFNCLIKNLKVIETTITFPTYLLSVSLHGRFYGPAPQGKVTATCILLRKQRCNEANRGEQKYGLHGPGTQQ